MTNEEIIEILKGKLEYYNSSLAEYYDEELINALEEANKKIKENTKLKAENERLKELMPKICETCEYEDEIGYEEPCNSCNNCRNWKLKSEE